MLNFNADKAVMYPVNNGYAPAIDIGPRALSFKLDFNDPGATDGQIYVDLTRHQTEGKIGTVQAIFVDNSENPDDLIVIVSQTLQRLKIPANNTVTQPIFAPDPCQLLFITTPGAIPAISVQLINVPLAPSQMGPITVNVSTSSSGTYTDASGTIAVGGASQALFAANALRKGMLVQNPSSEIESLFINTNGAATIGQPSIEITPGNEFQMQIAVTTQAVTITAATTGHTFTAKELA